MGTSSKRNGGDLGNLVIGMIIVIIDVILAVLAWWSWEGLMVSDGLATLGWGLAGALLTLVWAAWTISIGACAGKAAQARRGHG